MKVFLAIPAGRGVVTTGVLGLVGHLRARSEDYYLGIVNNARGIPYARNLLTEQFMQTDCEKLWFLDADVQPPANVFELLDVDGDIVAGTYPQLNQENGNVDLHYIAADDKDRAVRLSKDPMEVGYVAFGCTLIDRSVLSAPEMLLHESPRSWYQEVLTPTGKMKVSDDVDFCKRARKEGYKVVCHGGVRFGHVKSVDLGMLMPYHDPERVPKVGWAVN